MKTLSIRNFAVWFATLMGFWYIMSGFFDVVHTLMGVVSVGAVMALNHQLRKHKYFEDEIDVMDKIRYGRLFYYLFWLAWEILVSGIHVARLILSPGLPIKPCMVRFKVNLPSAHAKMILGNSITLTPGTLTVDINDDEFLVHAITQNSYRGILNDSMPQQVLRLFTDNLHPVVSDATIITDIDHL